MHRNQIELLSQETIDKIAAGEVVERPSSVVKELLENAIDAGASAITIEIKDGGTSLIRITDNGFGIPHEEIKLAFLRHSTSKIRNSNDLDFIQTLGFRGEALSSISAVSYLELLTKTADEMIGSHYVIEGAKELTFEEMGCPNGTTFIIRNLFYNTPARKKFLKSAQTEASYIVDMTEHLALSHPEISFSLISNGAQKVSTSGNGNLKDCIYQIYGKDITKNLLDFEYEGENYKINGFIGKPTILRGNRSTEIFFINGRFVKSKVLSKAIEDGYAGFCMLHQYPFAVLFFTFSNGQVDVNVHPTKMEVRIENSAILTNDLEHAIQERLLKREDIANVSIDNPTKTVEKPVKMPEPFETNRMRSIKEQIINQIHDDTPYERKYEERTPLVDLSKVSDNTLADDINTSNLDEAVIGDSDAKEPVTYVQQSFLSEEAKKNHKIIGQLFNTYWLVEFDNKLYIIDQHAAHEKVLYEKTMALLKDKQMSSQQISPPIVVTLSEDEIITLEKINESLNTLGYEIEYFGGKEYTINAIPADLYSIDPKNLLINILNDCKEGNISKDNMIIDRIASMSCKAAVKGHDRLSEAEAKALIDELLLLDNPYHCPHGRPTIISMTQSEIEKKFKRIL